MTEEEIIDEEVVREDEETEEIVSEDEEIANGASEERVVEERYQGKPKPNITFIDWLAETKQTISQLLKYDKELETLLIITRFPEGVTKHRLEEETKINGIRINNILARLRNVGLIYELTDRKKQLVFPTGKGKTVDELIVKFSQMR